MYLKHITKAALLGVSLAALAAAGASAKTLVYCSEGSPEGFDPGIYTAGTTFDASSRTVYNRLLEFEHGKTSTVPGLAESYDVSDDGLEYTFQLRPGVKFQTTDFFTPTRDFNADDVVFSFERQLKADNPWNQYVAGAAWEYSAGMGFPELIKSVEKVDDLTVKFVLTHPEAPFLADLAMDFASIMSKEYADKLEADGKKEQLNQQPLGTGPFEFVAYEPDAVIRYSAHEEYWAGQGEDRRPRLRHHHRRGGAGAEAAGRRMPHHALSERGRRGGPEGQRRPDRSMKQEGLNVAYLAYNTLIAAVRQARGPQGSQHGDQQAGDRRRGLPGRGDAGEEPDPADDVVLQRRHRGRYLRSGRGEGGARGGRRGGPVDEGLGDAGVASLHAERAARGGADPGGFRQDRRDRRDRLLRMGRVSRALEGEGPRRRGDPRLDRRQRRPGQLPRRAARLRRGRRQQPRPVVQRGVRQARLGRQGHRRPGRAHEAL